MSCTVDRVAWNCHTVSSLKPCTFDLTANNVLSCVFLVFFIDGALFLVGINV